MSFHRVLIVPILPSHPKRLRKYAQNLRVKFAFHDFVHPRQHCCHGLWGNQAAEITLTGSNQTR